MKNQKITVTAAELNDHSDHVYDTDMTLYIRNGNGVVTGTRLLYPKQVSIMNTTNKNIEVNFFRDDEEYNAYVADPTDYDFIYLPPGTSFTTDGFYLPVTKKFVIRGLNVAGKIATSDLRIDMINYQPTVV